MSADLQVCQRLTEEAERLIARAERAQSIGADRLAARLARDAIEVIVEARAARARALDEDQC